LQRGLTHRCIWLAATAGLVALLLWLDQNRGGPASMLSRCNLLLSRSETPAADVLIIGSSRSGTAVDPQAMEKMLARAFDGAAPKVERIALGHNPLRATHALLENYLHARGAPQVIALELMFMTRRSVDRIAQSVNGVLPEDYIFRRDLNLMTFEQILSQPAVAMPFTEGEGWFNKWRYRARGVVLRAGALVYQFLHRPTERWQLSECNRAEWTKEPTWPTDFAFSYGDYEPVAPPADLIEPLEAMLVEDAAHRTLKPWQAGIAKDQRYPYDFEEPYRQGELVLLSSMLELASRYGVQVVLLPLPLFGHRPSPDDLRVLVEMLPMQSHVFDLYAKVRCDLDKFWYDDGHIEVYPAGALTTAILAQHLLDTGLLTAREAAPEHD
jgi:hypothetical protein